MNATIEKAIKNASGVSLHGNSLRVTFRYKGAKCRETLAGLDVTKDNVQRASDMVARIRHEIATGDFNYRKHFPESSKAKLFSDEKEVKPQDMLVRTWVKEYVDDKLVESSASGGDSVRKRANRFLKDFRDDRIDNISERDLNRWQKNLVKPKSEGGEGLATTYVNDLFTVPRQIFGRAFRLGVIKMDPTVEVKNFDPPEESNNADPFTREEITMLEMLDTRFESERAMFCFNIWVGLSASEVIAMSWDDIDFNNWTLRVRRGRVNAKDVEPDEYKVPKEVIRSRTVEIIPLAQRWLLEQKERTAHLPPVRIRTTQRDNVTVVKEDFRPVWTKTGTTEAISGDRYARDILKGMLKSLGVAVRGVNQIRHTFASQMLSNFVPKDWIIRQLGHTGYDMLHRHYGRFIKDDTRSMGTTVMRCLGEDAPDQDVSRGTLKIVSDNEAGG